MQGIFHILSGHSLVYSFLLIIGATFPLLILLANMLISIKKKKHEAFKDRFFEKSLSSIALLGCLIIGIYSLEATPLVVQLTLHLGSLLGLVLGIILCVLMPWGDILFWGFLAVLIFPVTVIYDLSQLVKKWLTPRRTGQNYPSSNVESLPKWPLFFVGSFILIYSGYAFLITQLTASPGISFWSTLISAPIPPLLLLNFFLLIDIISRSTTTRQSSPARLIGHILSRWIASVHIAPAQPSSPDPLIDFLEQAPGFYLLAMSTLLPLIILTLIGGIIGSFLI